MLITRLILNKYKPLTTIEKIDYEPTATMQTILGTNGCGKSSLLLELNPMPAVRANYGKGGYKTIFIEFSGNQYKLSSEFKGSGGGEHLFYKNGEQLNQSKSIAEQRDLVTREFNYTDNIHKLLVGQVNFTEMTPAKRKEVLMEISPLELSYGLKVFDQLKVMLRDSQGATKHLKLREEELHLSVENAMVEENIDELIKGVEDRIQKIIPFIGNSEHGTVDDIENTIISKQSRLNTMVKEWDRYKPMYLLDEGIKDLSDLNEAIGKFNGIRQTLNERRLDLTEKIFQAREVTDSLSEKQMTPEGLKNELAGIKGTLSTLDREILFSRPTIALKLCDEVITGVREIAGYYDGKVYTREEIESINKIHEEIEFKLTMVKDKINRIENEITHVEEDGEHTCPKCDYRFNVRGRNPEEYKAELLTKKDDLLKTLEIGKGKFDESLKEVGLADEFISLCRRIDSLRRTTGNNLIWSEEWTNSVIIGNFTGFNNHCIKLRTEAELDTKQSSLELEAERIENAIKSIELLGDNIHTVQEMELDLEVTQCEIENINKKLEYYDKFKINYVQYSRMVEQAAAILDSLQDDLIKLSKVSMENYAQELKESLYDELSHLRTIVQKRDMAINSLENVRKDLVELKENGEVLSLCIDALGPIRGEIADQMNGFTTTYIDSINDIISKVWTVGLEVLPCLNDKGNMDYKFPMDVEGSRVGDISLGSEGQKEFINWCFVLIARQYLGLQDYPLFLDELGIRFDIMHRENLQRYIKTLLDAGQCSQIFMINHYAEVQGGLSNHECLVMDSRNISIPSIHNNHVTLEYK